MLGIERNGRHAHAGRHAAARPEVVLPNRGDERVRASDRGALGRAAQEQAVFVTAVPGGDVYAGDGVDAQERGHLLQDAVALRVTVAVVDGLKAVGVHEPERERQIR